MVGMANALGLPMEYDTTQDIQQEIRKILPGYYNLGMAAKVTPNPSRYFSNGYVKDVGPRYSIKKKGNTHRPFGLRMTQLLYHSGKLSTQASGLIEISSNKKNLYMGSEDLKNVGLISGDRIRLTSDQGTLDMMVAEDTSLMPGTCMVPEHFNDPPVKDLMPLQVDSITGVPYFKLVHVTVEKA
jgi:formate dehydrogenase alpha subunit